jgi:aspartate aminotransferase-like enzyme
MHEAAVRNFASRTVLSCVNGAFAKRWYDVAVSNGKEARLLETEWDQPITPELVADALKSKHFEIITVVHNETSTGLMNPIEEIAAAVRETSPDTLICVDAVSSLSGTNLEMDAWGLDMVLTSSQKALALPPGLALAGVNDRAMARAERVENRGWYFDLVKLEKYRTTSSTPATPAISLIYALDCQLDRIFDEGLEKRFARHGAMAAKVQSWALERGYKMFAPEGYRSQTVTTIDTGGAVNYAELTAFLLEREMRIANGYGPLKDRTFRIGHMGELQVSDVEELLAAIDQFLAQ